TSSSLKGVSYYILGCGNSDWAATFQDVPRRIDAKLETNGAVSIIPTEELDARGDVDSQFHDWLDCLLPKVGKAFELDLDAEANAVAEPLYSVAITESVTANQVADQFGARDLEVVSVSELKNPNAPDPRSSKHVELKLPEGMTYQPGDHLCVIPVNDQAVVERLLSRFGLDRDTYITVESRSEMRGRFPSGSTFSVLRLAETAGELQAVATRKDLKTLAHYCECPNARAELEALASSSDTGEDRYTSEVHKKRKSVLDILEKFPACDLPLGVFLELIPFMSPRYYSIASAPEATPGECAVCVGVVKGPALSGKGEFKGTCSNYLAELEPGARVKALVRIPTADFRLPDDPKTPIIMVGPGTGIAPFRSFLQQRAAQLAQGTQLGEALLFYGCRHRDHDFMYRDELERYAADGLVSLFTAFSRKDGQQAYVQDLISQNADQVWNLLEAGGRFYVCGDGAKMEPDVRRTLIKICANKRGCSPAAAASEVDEMIDAGRYVLDVWVG
ncbi:MAG: NADPH--cytochrome reductase, partial [Pseudomonadota bacterium]